jgi:RNA polymerase sigma factor (sigma-70 family)
MEQTLHLMDSLRCEQLWRRHADRLLLYAATVLSDRSAAEDVLQNVFVRLMASPPEEIDSESGYLFRAVRNEALNSIRSRRLAARAWSPLFDDVAEDPRESVELKERGKQVEQVLLRLGPEEREAVVLKIWGDLSMPEAAAVAGVSEKTFEHRYYRGLAALKEKLGDLHHDEL